MDEVKWYENNSLESIKNIIKDNINTASRSFLAIGYYLKNVRERELYQQDGYQNIWEFAQNEFGISQSWASRYMSINDRFSKDGNSPMIQEEYQGFDKSKLSEMLTLTDDQLKQVTLTTTVAEIKGMKKSYATSHKTEPEKIAPAQLESEPDKEKKYDLIKGVAIWCLSYLWDKLTPIARTKGLYAINFDEVLLEIDTATYISGSLNIEFLADCISASDEFLSIDLSYHDVAMQMGSHWNTVAEIKMQEKKQPDIPVFEVNSEAYGATWNTIVVSLISEMVEINFSVEDIIDGICCHAFGKNYYAYNIENDGYITIDNNDENPIFRINIERFKEEYEWHKARLATLSPEDLEDDEKTENEQDKQKIATGYEKEVDESYNLSGILRVSEKYITMLAKLFVKEKTQQLKHGCSRLGNPSDNEIIDMIKLFSQTAGLVIDWDIEVSAGAEFIEFSRGDEDLGICLYQKFTNCVRKQLDIINNQIEVSDTTDSKNEKSEVVEVDVIQDEVIDPEYYSQNDVNDELSKLKEYVELYRKNNDMVPGRRKAKMRLDAIILLDKEMHKPPVIEELEPEQPELPVMKNNDQRKDFIDNYTSWPVWIDQAETGEKYYRYDLYDKVAIVVKVSRKHSFAGYKETKDYEYSAEQYYLLGVKSEWHTNKTTYKEDESRTFYECNTNKSALVDYLKEIQKK